MPQIRNIAVEKACNRTLKVITFTVLLLLDRSYILSYLSVCMSSVLVTTCH